MKIQIETVPHESQRYETAGDWFWVPDEDKLIIRVSELGDWRHNFLVMLHELVEVMACKHDGVTQKQVDDFDMDFEANRKPNDESEPGDDPKAPYRKQHCLATGIERILAAELDVEWKLYEEKINEL